MSELIFPLRKKAFIDPNPDGFRTVDLASCCPIPVPGAGHPGAFAHRRRHHIHEGVDLYGLHGDPVGSLFAGTVVAVTPFTGPAAGFDWWLDTWAVMVEGPLGVACHGEILPADGIQEGVKVEAGQTLGTVARVLRNDKGRPLHMLHMELYLPGTRRSIGLWELDAAKPANLLDPTPLLIAAAGLPPNGF